MSLNFKLDGIKNYKDLCWKDDISEPGEKKMNAVTNALIWISIPCGFDEITSKNAPKLFQRIRVYEKMNGAMNRKFVDNKPVPVFLTYQDIIDHQGLTTNASTLTDISFKKNVMDNFFREEQRTTNRLIAEHFETPDSGEAVPA